MDLMALGINTAIVGGILALTNVLKSLDEKNKLVRFYPVIPLVLGTLAAYLKTDPFDWKAFGLNVIIYVGSSTYLFKFGKTTLLNQ